MKWIQIGGRTNGAVSFFFVIEIFFHCCQKILASTVLVEFFSESNHFGERISITGLVLKKQAFQQRISIVFSSIKIDIFILAKKKRNLRKV